MAAETALTEANREVMPLANKADGKTTAKAPYTKENAIDARPQTQAADKAKTTASVSCAPTTCQTDKVG
jgi:hypothetical protein